MTETIDAEPALEAALASPRYLLFKHSRSCPISARAFHEYRAWAEANPGQPTGWIDVIAGRALSQDVAARTGERHESPQAILLEGGRATWSASHGAITRASLSDALAAR
jgi:bacillithiol system protein YtxJ